MFINSKNLRSTISWLQFQFIFHYMALKKKQKKKFDKNNILKNVFAQNCMLKFCWFCIIVIYSALLILMRNTRTIFKFN